jgi:hypothetical protein
MLQQQHKEILDKTLRLERDCTKLSTEKYDIKEAVNFSVRQTTKLAEF